MGDSLPVRRTTIKKGRPHSIPYQMLFDLVRDGLVVHQLISEGSDPRFIHANPAACEILGYTAEEMKTLTPFDIQNEKDIPFEAEKMLSGSSLRFEKMLIRKDGSKFPAEVSSRVFYDRDRPMVLSSIRDITERKEAERKLKESEATSAHVQQMAHVGHWERDFSTGKVRWSDETYRIFGLRPQERKVDGPFLFQHIHPDDRARVEKAMRDAAEGIQPYDEIYRFVRPDGSTRWVHARAEVTRTPDGKPISISGTMLDITERKRAEETLKRYELLAGEARDIILFVRHRDGRILEANEAATKAYGYSKDELLSLTVYDLRGREGYSLTDSQMDKADLSGILFETDHRRKDGTTFPVEVSSRGIRIGDERVLLSVIRDITKRKLVEEELRRAHAELEQRVQERTNELLAAYRSLQQSEARYKNLYDQANDIIFTIDLKGNLTGVNAKGIDLFVPPGVPIQEISLGHLLTPDSLARAVAIIGRGVVEDSDLTDEQPWEFETRAKDGGLIYLEVKARLAREHGIITGINGIARDITRRKKLEEERAKLWSAVERAGEGIFMLTLDRRYSYVNAAFCKTYGVTQEELAGKSTAMFRSDRHPQRFHDTLWSELEAGNTWSGRQTRKRKDGGLVEVEATIAPVRDMSGAIIHYVGVERDITKQLQIEQQLRQTQKMEALGTLAGGVAHDFNNMLAIIIGNSELALDDAQNETLRQNLNQILKASTRSRDLIKQILTFSRRDRGQKKEIKMAPLLKETCELLRASLPSTIHMNLNVRTRADTILADPSLIQQVVVNLAKNAADAMREAGGRLTISLSSVTVGSDSLADKNVQPGHYAKLTVKDNGSGIAPDVKKRIFEPFFTTKEQGRGTGMGLAVVYGIVEGHNGVIEVESEIGKGSQFTVLLPQVDACPSMEEDEEATVCLGDKRTLLVDDEPEVVEVAKTVLERMGCRVTAFTDSTEALNLFLQNPEAFDLIMTDQTMPDLTGIDLARKILRVRKDIPIVLITGYSEMVSPEKAREVGIREFVMKPFTRKDMGEAIRRVLDEKEPGATPRPPRQIKRNRKV